MQDFILEKSSFILVIVTLSMVVALYSTYAERKVAAFLQDRIGPNRAGPWGLLQPLADGGKFFFKEEFMPAAANKMLFIIGPGVAMFTALMASAVIPWGADFLYNGRTISLQITDINVGILFLMGVLSVGVYGILIGGWASNNKYSLFSAIRASSQMISYELAMGMVIITIVMMTGSLNLKDIVMHQSKPLFGIAGLDGLNWNIFYQPLGFVLFLTSALAECNRAPFDLAECESELIGGYHTEYSSMKLGFFLFAEYINMFISSAVISILFFGGYAFPGMQNFDGVTLALLSFGVMLLKTFTFIFIFMWIRWTLPRFRYDQLMKLGWGSMIPLALINMLITAAVILWLQPK